MKFHSQALEFGDEETGGGSALSRGLLLLEKWQAKEGKGTFI